MFGVETDGHLYILCLVAHFSCPLDHAMDVSCQLNEHLLYSLVILGAHFIIVHPVFAG